MVVPRGRTRRWRRPERPPPCVSRSPGSAGAGVHVARDEVTGRRRRADELLEPGVVVEVALHPGDEEAGLGRVRRRGDVVTLARQLEVRLLRGGRDAVVE